MKLWNIGFDLEFLLGRERDKSGDEGNNNFGPMKFDLMIETQSESN